MYFKGTVTYLVVVLFMCGWISLNQDTPPPRKGFLNFSEAPLIHIVLFIFGCQPPILFIVIVCKSLVILHGVCWNKVSNQSQSRLLTTYTSQLVVLLVNIKRITDVFRQVITVRTQLLWTVSTKALWLVQMFSVHISLLIGVNYSRVAE
jgi:hypothetical protein